MDQLRTIQYQALTDPTFTGGETVSADKWLIQLSEPVRQKRINAALQAPFFAWGEFQFKESTDADKWYEPLSEPKRYPRILNTALQQAYIADPLAQVGIDKIMSKWFQPFQDPKRFKQGLQAQLQHYFEAPPRLLPNPSVTGTMAAREVNTDVFLGAINVYTPSSSTISGAGARVSIVEVKVGGDPVSVIEQ